jgi:hypothetical protein
MTPTARTLTALRRSGYVAEVVERWIPGANIRKDLFGIGDVIAVRAGDPGPLLIQCTTADHVSHRRRKALASPGLRTWLAAGGRFELWGWQKRGNRWEARRENIGTMPPVSAMLPKSAANCRS